MVTTSSCLVLFCVLMVASATDIQYHLLEEQAPQTHVGNVAIDANLMNESDFSRLRFEIMKEGSQYADWFTIGEKNGKLETAEVIDREDICTTSKSCVLSLDIFIYKESADNPDDLDLFKAFQINIILDDINDNSPTFPKPELSLSIPESSDIGYVLLISTASDPDGGDTHGVDSYELASGDDTFVLQKPGENGGNLGIVVNKALNREEKSFYRLKVVAKDGVQPPRSGSVMINITVLDTNDNSPVFESTEYTKSIPENLPVGATIVKVTATDNDVDENGRVSYRFSARASEKVRKTFNIDGNSGDITIRKNVDYETDKSFQFPVEAYDNGASSRTAIAVVNIAVLDLNDNAPQIHITLPPGGLDILESAEVDRYIAFFEAHDSDSKENGTVSCTIDSDYFRLEPISSAIYQIKLNKNLDRETLANHNIRITCSDNGNPKQSNSTLLKIRVVDVNDNFPKFNQSLYVIKFRENNEIGEVVGMVTANDNDTGDHARLSYQIQHKYDHEYFRIDRNSGLITANISFDRETKSVYNFEVIANDFGEISLSASTSVQVNIIDDNDGFPTFSEMRYIFNVSEGEPTGTEVGNVTVTDHDVGVNGEISFLQDYPYDDVFVVDPTTGKISTKVVLDREVKQKYIFDLKVQDKGNDALTSTTKIEIDVIDKNDNVPIISFPTSSNNTVYIPMTTTIGSTITRVNVVDLDDGRNAELTFHIMQGDKRRIFRMNNLTGAIMVDKVINEDDTGTYTLLIAVQDNGIPQLTAWSSLVLIIQGDDGQKNMIIAIAVATVTFALSAAMILTIFVIRRRDSLKDKEKALQVSSEKQKNVIGWLKRLSSPSKDGQKNPVSEKVKDTNRQLEFARANDMQPIVPDSGSTSSDDSKSSGPGSNPNVTKVDNLKEKTGEMSPREQDSGFGESLERRVLHEMKGALPKDNNRTQFLDSRGIRIPSPYLDTSLPTRCWKKSEKPSYTRNMSLDEQMLRDREKQNHSISGPTSTSFNCRSISDSGNNSELYPISEQNYVQRQPYGFHSLQRNNQNNKTANSKYSLRNSSRRDLPPISATPEPETSDSNDYDSSAYKHLPYSLERHSQSDNHINISNDPHSYSPRLQTFYTPRSKTYSESGLTHSPRSDIYVQSSGSDTYVHNPHSETYIDSSRLKTQGNSQNGVLNTILNQDIVV